MDINNPFQTFQKYAFRLEALPQYIVDDERVDFENFQKYGHVDCIDNYWSEVVSNAIESGKRFERLRLLSEKLTDYERFELQAYTGPSVGEDIHTALRKDYPDDYKYDFWLFDDEWIAQVNYESDGTFINFDVRSATEAELTMYKFWHEVYLQSPQLRQVPFVSNTLDDTHCLQAAYMSIAKYFDTSFDIKMHEWSQLTGYEEGLGTWANAGLIWFQKNGYDVIHYEMFNFEEFINHPKDYMIEIHGEEAGLWGIEHTNIDAEIPRMKELLSLGVVEKRKPRLEDVFRFIDEGYLVRVTINCGTLDGHGEYVGHAVVITGYNDTFIQFHDPGLPPIPNRQATHQEFVNAWSDQERELDAIRLPK